MGKISFRDRVSRFRHCLVILHSGLFFVDYYRLQHCDGHPWLLVDHYMSQGVEMGMKPNPLFDGDYYRQRYPDIRLSGANPLVHFINWGASEKRDPHPAFSTRAYLEAYEDVAKSGINPLFHWLYFGQMEGRRIFPAALDEQ